MSLVAYLGIASGAGLVLTALGLAVARPQRVGGWLFVAFLTAWGTETILFNTLGFIETEAYDLMVTRLGLIVVLVEALFLVHFTVRFTRSMETRHRWWSWGALAFVVGVGGAFALDPGLFAGRADDSLISTVFISAPKFVAIFITVGILASRHRATQSEIEHREVRVVLFGLTLYAAYTAGFYLSLYGLIWTLETPAPSHQVLASLFVVATLFLAGLAVRSWRSRETPEHWSAREKPMLLAAILVPLVLGLVTGTAQIVDLPRIDLFGLVRIGTALLVAYGLVKFEIFDIDRQVKRALRGSVIAGAFVLAFFLVSEGVEALVSDAAGTWAGLAAAGVLTLGFRPIEQRANRLADRAMPRVDDSDAYMHARSAEVYQAAVERAARDEVLTDREKRILVGLREDLGLREEQAREIERKVFPEPVAVTA